MPVADYYGDCSKPNTATRQCRSLGARQYEPRPPATLRWLFLTKCFPILKATWFGAETACVIRAGGIRAPCRGPSRKSRRQVVILRRRQCECQKTGSGLPDRHRRSAAVRKDAAQLIGFKRLPDSFLVLVESRRYQVKRPIIVKYYRNNVAPAFP